ncbi:asparaginase [Cohnella zeiphila]|uniref:Asparaginase n=1 Tax=Cohnella zeiphila TaxID=2761120 RepID=A0A7X0VVG6_9BACL|nr:asparaginase [Cohnella zeiphila]MBB6731961.1 asparaginase [Cohnella zeiphila]
MSEWTAMPDDVPLVVATRGELAENEHKGRWCVVAADGGGVLQSGGDVRALTYLRSAGKPLQAIEPLLGGVAEAFRWEERHLAMLGASQRGLPEQVAAVEEMRERAGIPEDAFVFRAVAPTNAKSRDEWARAGEVPRRIYHTCAGKHLGMMAWCKLEGWPLQGYAEPDHPAQRRITARVREWAGASDGALGLDGCGLPVAAVPLSGIALAYARLACPDDAPDPRAAAAAARVTAAMGRYPELVEGPGRLASLLLADPNIVAKSGAQGLFAFGLRRERLGVAVHLSDGTEAAWGPVVIALLERIGGASEETLAALRARFPRIYRNDAGAEAGAWEAVF